MIPNRYFEFSLNLLHKMDKHLGNYLRGQFLDALLFGLMATLVLWILDVKYPLFIGAFAGAANLIPYLGPLVGATLAAVVTFLYSGDLTRVAYVGIAFMAVKLLDDAVIQPLVLARSVRMHPLAVVSVTIVGGQFFGILGMFLAVPVAGFIKIAVQESMRTLSRFRISRERAG
jgi:predicted PurR-regulated permease PerM